MPAVVGLEGRRISGVELYWKPRRQERGIVEEPLPRLAAALPPPGNSRKEHNNGEGYDHKGRDSPRRVTRPAQRGRGLLPGGPVCLGFGFSASEPPIVSRILPEMGKGDAPSHRQVAMGDIGVLQLRGKGPPEFLEGDDAPVDGELFANPAGVSERDAGSCH